MREILILCHSEAYSQFLDKLYDYGINACVLNKKNYKKYKKKHISFFDINLDDYEELLNFVKILNNKHNFESVISFHELYQLTTEMISKELNLPNRNLKYIQASTNKLLMKKIFKEKGIKTASYEVISLNETMISEIERIENLLNYPLVIKPCTGLFSAGVTKIYNKNEFIVAYRNAKRITCLYNSSSATKESSESLIIEEYIHGKEFNLDGFAIKGKWNYLMSAEKFPDLHGPKFQENGLFLLAEKNEYLNLFNLIGKQIIESFPVGDSPYHIELRLESTTNELYVVEFSTRLSGMGVTIFNMLYHSTGFDIYEFFLDNKIGKSMKIQNLNYLNGILELDLLANGYGQISRFEGLEKIRTNENVVYFDLLKKIGDTIINQEYNIETIATVYVKFSDREDAICKINKINNTLKVMYI